MELDAILNEGLLSHQSGHSLGEPPTSSTRVEESIRHIPKQSSVREKSPENHNRYSRIILPRPGGKSSLPSGKHLFASHLDHQSTIATQSITGQGLVSEPEDLLNSGLSNILNPSRHQRMHEYGSLPHDPNILQPFQYPRMHEYGSLPHDPNILQPFQYPRMLELGSVNRAHAGVRHEPQNQAGATSCATNEQHHPGTKRVLEQYPGRLEMRKPYEWQESSFLNGAGTYDAQRNSAEVMNVDSILSHRYVAVASGSHLDLDVLGYALDQLPYHYIRMLGRGGSASVEMVKDANTGSVYARKVVRNVYTRNLKEARKMLHNEVQIMGKLREHHHMVKIHATYIAKRELAIILSPVADGGDLASYLQERRDNSTNGLQSKPDEILQRSFGCLASGLAYMHKHTIRHKDVKPQNILIHKGAIMFTDFGLSYDFADTGQSTTTGPVQGLTRRYCAPEVAEGRGRNSSSDIFSLGCVYLEIVDSLYAGYIDEDLLAGPFHEKLRTLNDEFWDRAERNWEPVISLLKGLLSHEPSGRPSADKLVGQWFNLFAAHPQNEFFCIPCLHTSSLSS
jgi:serine/threonine protein kinase